MPVKWSLKSYWAEINRFPQNKNKVLVILNEF